MGTLSRIKFILAWNTYRVGDVIQPNGTLRQWLVNNGYAVVLDEPKVERAMVTPAAERATVKRGKR